MFTRTVQYKDAVLTISRDNVRSRLLRGMVYRHFDIEAMDESEFLVVQGFVQFLTQVKIDGEVGFEVPAITADTETMLAGYAAFSDMSPDFFDAYYPALIEVDKVVGDPEVAPGNGGKKKAS